MKNEAKKLGKNLKHIRTKKGISQVDIARYLVAIRGFVSNIENGKTNSTLAMIVKLTKTIGVTSNELLK